LDPCYSQSLLLADFRENYRYSTQDSFKNLYKQIRETK
jgi:hypothetical protein